MDKYTNNNLFEVIGVIPCLEFLKFCHKRDVVLTFLSTGSHCLLI